MNCIHKFIANVRKIFSKANVTQPEPEPIILCSSSGANLVECLGCVACNKRNNVPYKNDPVRFLCPIEEHYYKNDPVRFQCPIEEHY